MKKQTFKKLFALIISIMLILSIIPLGTFTVSAVQYGYGYYSYTVNNGEAEITDCDESISGDITIPSTLGGYPVTSIGNRAFLNCSSLTNINMPNSVTSIGFEAFYGCSSIANIDIPSSVTSIGGYAFNGTAYYNNQSNWENGVLYIDNCLIGAKFDISGEYIIKDGTRVIAYSVFEDCDRLASITIPDSVIIIAGYAFDCCDALTSVTIGDGVTSVGEYAFYGCSSLEKINIPNSVMSIDACAFEYCHRLTSVTIGDSATIIGGYAFKGCTNMTSITIPKSVTDIGEGAFSNCGNLKIYCHENSYAHYYAVENYIKYEFIKLIGDPSGDGVIDANDLPYFRKALLSNTDTFDERLDVTGDGKFNLADLVRIKKHLADNNIVLGKIN